MNPLSDAWDLAKRIFSNDVFQKALFPVMSAVSIVLYVGSFYIDEATHKPLREGLKSLAEVMLTTGLISMFINAFTYMGVFRGALGDVFVGHKSTIREAAHEALASHTGAFRTIMDEVIVGRDGFIRGAVHDTLVSDRDVIRDAVHEVLYSVAHLKHRNDLPEVWGRVSEALYDQRFPAIAELLRRTILTNLLPVGRDFYYGEYHRECELSWKDEAASIVQIREEIADLVIIPVAPDQTIYYKYQTEYDSRTPEELARVTLVNLTINGRPYHNVMKEEGFEDGRGGHGLRQHYSIPLEGQPSYRVRRVMLRNLSLNEDPIIDYRSTNFICGPTSVRVRTKAPTLAAHVIGNASGDFADRALNQEAARVWDIDLEYDGLIFPNQGYILILQKLDVPPGGKAAEHASVSAT
jgi:hypothetical protein